MASASCSVAFQDSVRSSQRECSTSLGWVASDLILAGGAAFVASRGSEQDPQAFVVPAQIFAGLFVASAAIGVYKRHHCGVYQEEHPPAVVCSGGARAVNNVCYCAEGQSWNGLACQGTPVAENCGGGGFAFGPPGGYQCFCLDGFRSDNGQCVELQCTGGAVAQVDQCGCPNGQSWDGAQCVDPPPPAPADPGDGDANAGGCPEGSVAGGPFGDQCVSCPGGMIPTGMYNRDCACPDGTVWNGAECAAPQAGAPAVRPPPPTPSHRARPQVRQPPPPVAPPPQPARPAPPIAPPNPAYHAMFQDNASAPPNQCRAFTNESMNMRACSAFCTGYMAKRLRCQCDPVVSRDALPGQRVVVDRNLVERAHQVRTLDLRAELDRRRERVQRSGVCNRGREHAVEIDRQRGSVSRRAELCLHRLGECGGSRHRPHEHRQRGDQSLGVRGAEIDALQLAIPDARGEHERALAVAVELVGVPKILEHPHHTAQEPAHGGAAAIRREHDGAREHDVLGEARDHRVHVTGFDGGTETLHPPIMRSNRLAATTRVPRSIYDDAAMAELVVIGFKNDISRAAAVLGELRAADEPWTRGLHGAIATYREHGQLTIDQSYESTKGNAVIGGSMIGSLVGLALAAIALPITAGISGAVAFGTFAAGAIGGSIVGARHTEEASWWKDDVKIPEPFLDNVRACVLDGDSAIFFLLRSPAGIDFAERFRRYNGTVFHTTLTPEQSDKVHDRLAIADQLR